MNTASPTSKYYGDADDDRAGRVRDRLAAKGMAVPVVDPTGAAITWLESSVRLGLTPSRTTYMSPPAKDRKS